MINQSLKFLIALGIALLATALVRAAAPLMIGGLSDQQEIILPTDQSSTNLLIHISASQTPAAGPFDLVLETDGRPVFQSTPTIPGSITLSNLAAGKYLLLVQSRATLPVTPVFDLAFDIVRARQTPPNDNWTNAITIQATGQTVTGNNRNATAELDEPGNGSLGIGQSVWWKWQAPSEMAVVVSTEGSTFDTILSVYTGTNLAHLKLVAANDDVGASASSQVAFHASAGAFYSIRVDRAPNTFNPGDTDDIRLRIIVGTPPVVGIISPANGSVFWATPSGGIPGSIASASVTSSSQIARVDYTLHNADGRVTNGTTASPYQINLPALPTGNYVLAWTATDAAGLVSATNTTFSVRSKAGVLHVHSPPLAGANGFPLRVEGEPGFSYALEISDNLIDWTPLRLWNDFSGVQLFVDPDASSVSHRFYRLGIP